MTGAAVAGGDACHDLWFTRNLIMDRAGYCFGSTLGPATFDNSDCRGKSISLDVESARLVEKIRGLEIALGCAVDTTRRQLELDDLSIRRRLFDLPIAEEFPAGSLGWLEAKAPLQAGSDASSAIIGRIARGEYVGFFHVPDDDWNYVTVADPNWEVTGGGWLKADVANTDCQNWAGESATISSVLRCRSEDRAAVDNRLQETSVAVARLSLDLDRAVLLAEIADQHPDGELQIVDGGGQEADGVRSPGILAIDRIGGRPRVLVPCSRVCVCSAGPSAASEANTTERNPLCARKSSKIY